MTKEMQKALDRAKVKFMSHPNSTFMTTVLFSLNIHITNPDDSKIPTAGTDGIGLWINPKFFLSLNEEQRATLLYHEVGHVI